jgi:predicted Zn-dependent protease
MTHLKIKLSLISTLLCAITVYTASSNISANSLPSLGDFSSSIVSLDTEYKLGQGIIRKINAANFGVNDPIVVSYLQDLVWDLVATSQLTDKRISLAVIGNLSVNAFAAPGGVLGIHAGLILAAKAEDELASVISHELAHLSQRHFAAQIEQQRINAPFAIASMVAGILVAVANPEAGTAVLSSNAARQLSSRLAFSRNNEQEADRIGMLNLSKSGYSPDAMPRMFSRLLEIQRLQGSLPPEFLLSHPSSSARVADSKNRAAQLPKGNKNKTNLDFYIVQGRIKAKYAKKNKLSLNHFRTQASKTKKAIDIFTLALAAASSQNHTESLQNFAKLPGHWKQHLMVKISIAKVRASNQQLPKAIKSLKQLNRVYPKHLAIQLTLAETLIRDQQPKKAIKHLINITEYAPDNIDAWYLLAEAQGLAGNKNKLHSARIEYFLLKGLVQSAKQQLSFARRERRLSTKEIYVLDDLEQHILEVEDFMNTKY